MAGVHQLEYLVTAPMQDSMLAADSAADKLLAEEALKQQPRKARRRSRLPRSFARLGQLHILSVFVCLCWDVFSFLTRLFYFRNVHSMMEIQLRNACRQ